MIWRLKKGLEKKFLLGHPWVFSSDLDHSPRGIEPGSVVELQSHKGDFLAVGYGNPHSLIAFRRLANEKEDISRPEFWKSKLKRSLALRQRMDLHRFSHRLCFSEADGVSGLIIDRYRTEQEGQVWVLQSSTAGIDKQMDSILASIEIVVREEGEAWEKTDIVIAKDSSMRKLEGIAIEEKRILRNSSSLDLTKAKIQIQNGNNGDEKKQYLIFTTDLIHGQKTGFFLDQRSNVQAVLRILRSQWEAERPSSIRVLDLCCYVGQWGAQISALGKSQGVRVEVSLLDASQSALELAKINVEVQGGEVSLIKEDVLKKISELTTAHYDVVICDPPAFIKGKKDFPQGRAAYIKLNREAMRRVAHGGVFFSSSCSGLLDEVSFREVLAEAQGQAFRGKLFADAFSWIYKGSHSPDHPQRPEFPQGSYLKSWLAVSFTRDPGSIPRSKQPCK